MIVDPDAKRVLLKSIPTLTFYDGELTTHRRTSAVPQLTCKGPACRSFKPDVVQCYNQGGQLASFPFSPGHAGLTCSHSDAGTGADMQWKCEADLPSSLKIGRVQVGCEGWDRAEDSYILKGPLRLSLDFRRR